MTGGCFLFGEDAMALLEKVNQFIWGVPALILIVGLGIYLSVKTRFAQFRYFPKAIRALIAQLYKGKGDRSGVSAYQALCTALAATVGTGNLAGVAGAIALGGPGALFWMWVCGVLGMVTKFAEATLAVRYRSRNAVGELVGGPMYMIRDGMGKKWGWLAGLYSAFGIIAALGVGNATQVNAVIGGVNTVITFLGGSESITANLVMGVVLGLLIVVLLLGGAKRIGAAAEKLVPFASCAYILLCITVLAIRAEAIPDALASIVHGAFSPRAVTGGALGSGFQALRVGAARGVFTNEAGLGTASIAHASANVRDPVEQGMMGIVEVFLDTIVICTMTGLVILCSGVTIPFGTDKGILLTSQAFSVILGSWVCIPISAAVCCFAVATVIGWGLYGARCCQFLFGDNAWKYFVFAQGVTVILGAVLGTGLVWTMAETVNGLMAIPNLIVLAYLAPELVRLVKKSPVI